MSLSFCRKNVSGFSLIEASISLIVVGIISSISFSQYRAFTKHFSHQKTMSNIDFCLRTIGAYYVFYGNKLSQKNIDLPLSDGYSRIPFKSFLIPEMFAKDGSGNWLLYRFDNDCGASKPMISIKFKNVYTKEDEILEYGKLAFVANFAVKVESSMNQRKQ